MKNKSTFNITPILTVIIFLVQFANTQAQIANNYPNDSLIHTDPDVVFVEMFEQNTINAMISSTTPNYQTSSMLSHINFDSSVPFGSRGVQSLKLTTLENSNASNDPNEDANILKKFSTGISDSVFVRYYVKFNNAHTFHHTGVWIGGTNPTNSCWPCNYPGRAIPTSGDSAFVVGTEMRGAANISAQSFSKFGFYNYWRDMKGFTSGPAAGKYYGNEFISPNSASTLNMSAWNCIEIMLKLNNPVTDSSGELKLWINGQLLAHYGKGFPNGTWNQATFNEGTGSPFDGFRWRSNPAVVFNYIWIKNYSSANTAYPTANDVLFDHIIVAKKYIGPIFTATPLPVELISFTGKAGDDKNTLYWATASEQNNNYFTILKSVNGNSFENIGKINGSGNSSQTLNYSYIDEHPSAKINYYKLQQTDYKGKNTFSKTIAINNSSYFKTLIISPNPATDYIQLSCTETKNIFQVEIINMFGETVSCSENQSLINVSHLPKGIYSLKVKAIDSFDSQTFIKQ